MKADIVVAKSQNTILHADFAKSDIWIFRRLIGGFSGFLGRRLGALTFFDEFSEI